MSEPPSFRLHLEVEEPSMRPVVAVVYAEFGGYGCAVPPYLWVGRRASGSIRQTTTTCIGGLAADALS